MEKVDATLDAAVRESIQWEQDTNLARGVRFIADWMTTGKAPSARDLKVISTMGRRAATSKATFGRILRATLASRDAMSAVVADTCHALHAPPEVMVGLLTGVHVAHDRILIYSAREFDIEAASIAQELANERAQLENLAKKDALTGVSNRRGFYEYLESILAQRRRRRSGQLVLFFVDLDHFKELNDAYGHQVGDEILRVIAERLSETARPSDQVARLGGDEFILVMNGLPENAEILTEIAGRILSSLRAPIVALGTTVNLTASVGITVAPEHVTSADQLVNSADRAMYMAKHAGRDTFQLSS
jgi:diguanylate cyclase (GGDEF)-like protein